MTKLFLVEVRIELKKGVMDAEGETVEKSLNLLGYNAKDVRAIKVYEMSIEGRTKNDARKKIEDACKKLLANPVIQNYEIKFK